jgi:hypothetical protein
MSRLFVGVHARLVTAQEGGVRGSRFKVHGSNRRLTNVEPQNTEVPPVGADGHFDIRKSTFGNLRFCPESEALRLNPEPWHLSTCHASIDPRVRVRDLRSRFPRRTLTRTRTRTRHSLPLLRPFHRSLLTVHPSTLHPPPSTFHLPPPTVDCAPLTAHCPPVPLRHRPE